MSDLAKAIEDIAFGAFMRAHGVNDEDGGVIDWTNDTRPYVLKRIGELLRAAESHPDAFQGRVRPWVLACFGAEIAADRTERCHRFLEEALELVQALGSTRSEAYQLVDYVFGRAIGEPRQEIGCVMVALAALCSAVDIDMAVAAEDELARVWTNIEEIRTKQAGKPKHSPLPESPHPAAEPRGCPTPGACSCIESSDTAAKAARCPVCEEIVEIADDRARQVTDWLSGTPGDFEHMGDVWNQIRKWAAAIRARTTAPSPPFDEAAERIAFEQWYGAPRRLERSPDDDYVFIDAHTRWFAWLARAKMGAV